MAANESSGGVYNPDGLNPSALLEFKQKTGTVKGFPGTQDISTTELLAMECDILVPAALENQLTAENAGDVKAKIIAEAANGPTTLEADAILKQKGALVIPDILANAGGVTVSYFEWVQNNMGYYWSEEEVNDRLEKVMVKSFGEVYSMHKNEEVDMRTAAYMVAVKRVAEAMEIRGWLGGNRKV